MSDDSPTLGLVPAMAVTLPAAPDNCPVTVRSCPVIVSARRPDNFTGHVRRTLSSDSTGQAPGDAVTHSSSTSSSTGQLSDLPIWTPPDGQPPLKGVSGCPLSRSEPEEEYEVMWSQSLFRAGVVEGLSRMEYVNGQSQLGVALAAARQSSSLMCDQGRKQ